MLDGQADRTQRRVGVDRVTDQRHEVDDVFAVLAVRVNFVRVHRSVGLPEFEQRLRLGLVNVNRFDRQAARDVFAHGDARAGHEVDVRHVLDNPTAVNKLLVDVLAGVVFGCQMKTDGKRWEETA